MDLRYPVHCLVMSHTDEACHIHRCVAVCCGVLQCVAVCCSGLQCVAMGCSVLQCATANIHQKALLAT